MSLNPDLPQPPLLIPLRSLPNVHTTSGNISHGLVFSQNFSEPSISSSALSSFSQIPYQGFDESFALVPNRNANHIIYSSNHIRVTPPFNPESISHLQLLQDPNVNFEFEQQQFASYTLGENAPTAVDTLSAVSDPTSLTRNLEFCVSGPFAFDCTPLFIQHPPVAANHIVPPPPIASVATTPSPAAPPLWSTNSLLHPHTARRSRKCTITLQEITRRIGAPEYYGLALLKAYLRFSNNRWAPERDRITLLLERELNIASKHQPLVSAFTRLSEGRPYRSRFFFIDLSFSRLILYFPRH